MIKKAIPAAVVLLALVAMGLYALHPAPAPATVRPPLPVGGEAAALANVPVYVEGPGTVAPERTVIVRTQIAGLLESVRFKEGQAVHAGDILATIDSRYLHAKLRQAEGQLARDRALMGNAQRDLERYRQGAAAGTVTRQTLDTQAALVAQYQGTLTTDQGVKEEFEVQLSYCTLTAPVDGIVGLRHVDAGNYVQPGDPGGIATVVTDAPITVVFPLPERDVTSLASALRKDGRLPASALDDRGRRELATGYLVAIDNAADAGTGTVRIKLLFPNAQGELFPNGFVNARVRVRLLQNALVVPTRAIRHGNASDFVYVIKGGAAAIRSVHTGPQAGDKTALVGGDVHAGDIVITDGVGRVADHMAVTMTTAAGGQRE
ncbi:MULTISPECIES: efflux RND transporter periplasmic adaptor subunit [unclassified Achromobacter]|uniref:efflux RND transporter periplasmic adaptor subunit n=1 Tax=unclassified Achromobacter TaxID=2626865 RepID=UPI000B5154EF|nr:MULTISPECIES: efflux RND transporter periplasmic adaptor subunit [unclassified Achromobacter]OWT79918.1 efflux transporter periplasmic adaptor subunit [Achromobacter sp. HZ34]OWT81802.1 efflux transporter periplasmic adaptor subunit [Achromobacter sp. HZ28]